MLFQFEPIAVETMGVYGRSTGVILRAIGRRLVEGQGSPGRLTGSVKTWLLLFSEAMPSVFSQPVGRGFRGSGCQALPNPSLCSCGNFLFHERFYYASPSSGEAYRDRWLTTNFELWVEIFCVPTCFHVRIPKPCLSVCLFINLSVPWEKKSPWPSRYQSYISNWYINGNVFTTIQHGNPKNWFFFSQKCSKLNFVRTPIVCTPRKEIALASCISVLH